MPERDPRRQLVTAVGLLALFQNQLGEWDRMNRDQRRSARGRDIEARLPGLRAGHAKWSARVAELRAQIAAETPPPRDLLCPECEAGKHRACAGFAFDADDQETDCQCACRDTPGGTE